jgi:uncharacterized protein (TIGR02246 family)
MSDADVLELVDRWAAAELAGDADGLADLLAADFAGIGPVGFQLDREQWAGRHRAGNLANAEFSVTEPRVRTYGDTAVVVAVLRQRTTAMGRDTSGSFRVGVVAVRQDGRWTIAQVQFSGPLIAPGELPSFAR